MNSGKKSNTRVILVALLANMGVAGAKFGAWLFTGSSAVLAEAVHSVVDCGNQLLLLLGVRRGKRPPTPEHPLGFGREVFFWSFLVAILLFSLGGLFAIYEGFHKARSGSTLRYPAVGLVVIALSMVLEGASLAKCLKQISHQNPYGTLRAWFHHTTSTELLVGFTEDTAALVGLSIAAVFLSLSWATANPIWDAIGSILIGVNLICVATALAVEIKSLIIGEAPGVDMQTEAEQIVKDVIPGAKIFRFIAVQTGPRQTTVAMKISCGAVTQALELVERINEVERRMRRRFPQIRWQFVEPDVRD